MSRNDFKHIIIVGPFVSANYTEAQYTTYGLLPECFTVRYGLLLCVFMQ